MRTLHNLLDAKKIVLYGAGNQYQYCHSFLSGHMMSFTKVVTTDSDKEKWGTMSYCGDRIVQPEEALSDKEDTNIVIS